MTKRDLAVRIASELNINQADVATVIQSTLDHITDELSAGRRVELRNFGVFELKIRKSRVGRNPKKPENVVTIPEQVTVKLKMGKIMAEKVAKLKAKDLLN